VYRRVSPVIPPWLQKWLQFFCRLPSPFHEFFSDVNVVCVNYIVASFHRIRLVSADFHSYYLRYSGSAHIPDRRSAQVVKIEFGNAGDDAGQSFLAELGRLYYQTKLVYDKIAFSAFERMRKCFSLKTESRNARSTELDEKLTLRAPGLPPDRPSHGRNSLSMRNSLSG
jgi:hypothetical protein